MIYYYLIINCITFFLFAFDKRAAIKHRYRISERTLFIFIIIGGCIGSYLAMWICHHKTRKIIFHVLVMISFIAHIILNTSIL